MDRLLRWGPFRKREAQESSPHREDARPPLSLPETGPELILLVADATGRASYHLNAFPSAAAAEAYIEFWFPLHLNEGIIAFWALTWEPQRPAGPTEAPLAEPIVLIRDARRLHTVYPFSFVSIDSALAFAREEVHWRIGLDQVAIYWAVPVRVVTDFQGRRRLVPGEPPQRPAQAGRPPQTDGLTFAAGAPTTAQSRDIRADNLRAAVEDALRSVLESASVDDMPAAELAAAAEEALRIVEERLDEDIADLRERRREALAAVEEALAVIRHGPAEPIEEETDEDEPQAEAGAQDPPQSAAAGEDVRPQKTAPPPDPAMTKAPDGEHLNPPTAEKPRGRPETGSRDAHQEGRRPGTTMDEIRKVLDVKRWEERDEPFQGFNSPPGRF